MRFATNFKNLAMNRKKYVSHWEEWIFKPIGNSAHKAEFLALRKVLNIYIDYIDYLMFYSSRQHVK